MTDQRSYAQHEREILVASLLDVSVAQMRDRLEKVGSDEVPDEYESQIVGVVQGLINQMMIADGKTPPTNDDYQTYLQSIALMGDACLHYTVRLLGTDPMPEVNPS
jgi:hypothetical protein